MSPLLFMADYPLIFIRQLKDMVGIEQSYAGSDTRLRLAIDSASRTVENLLGRKLSKNTYTEIVASKGKTDKKYDLNGSSDFGDYYTFQPVPVMLKAFPVDLSSPFEVYYDPGEQYAPETKLSETDYMLDAERVVLTIMTPVGNYKRGLKVVYTAGYEATVDTDGGTIYDEYAVPPQEKAIANTLPADLVQATIWQATLVYEKQYGGNLNVRYSRGEGSTNSVSYVNIGAVSPEAMAIIAQNKRPRFSVI